MTTAPPFGLGKPTVLDATLRVGRILSGTTEALDDRLTPIAPNDTYTPTGRILGYGSWGSVREYVDPSGQKWAIKAFDPDADAKPKMSHRNLTAEAIMRKEVIPLTAAQKNVVPRIIIKGTNGEIYVGMPVFDFLTKTIKDSESVIVDLEQAIKLASGIATGLEYIHTILRKEHGDLALKNIAVDEFGNPMISDFGTASCVSIDKCSSDARDNVGHPYVRAPEVYHEGRRPSRQSDVWSFGSLVYKLFTGNYVFQKETDENPNFLAKISAEEYDVLLEQKVKAVPRQFRKLVGKCLQFYGHNRYFDGSVLNEQLKAIVENRTGWNVVKQKIKQFTLPVVLGTLIAGASAYAIATHEPQKLNLPKTMIQGELYLPQKPAEEVIRFKHEQNLELPVPMVGMNINVDDRTIKLCTDNRVVATLTKSYYLAAHSLGGYYFTPSKAMSEINGAYTAMHPGGAGRGGPPDTMTAIRAIEFGLAQAANSDGSVDLEDAVTIARIGPKLFHEARLAAKSSNFKDYIDAKDGARSIIPKAEREFLKHWLAQTQKLIY